MAERTGITEEYNFGTKYRLGCSFRGKRMSFDIFEKIPEREDSEGISLIYY